jgi:tRNA(Ile)-lysidine synthase
MGNKQSFLRKFEEFVFDKGLLKNGDKILVGYSGGADSTALLTALWQLKSHYKLNLLAVHINYNLRAEESQQDEEFVKQFCFHRNISLVVENCDLESSSGVENNAREIRFKFFRKVAKLYKMNKIALGHNRKDQAETILFRLFRGSGYTGLKGIEPQTGEIVHPLLPFSRSEITSYLKQQKISWREDSTNQQNTYTRNKLRNVLLPWLEENLNTDIVNKLYQTANIFAETDQIMQQLAARSLNKATLHEKDDKLVLSIETLQKTLSALRYYLYRLAYQNFTGTDKDFYSSNFEEIEAVLDSEGSKQVDLPHDIVVLKEYDKLIFANKQILEYDNKDNSKEIDRIRNRSSFEDYRIIMKKLKKLPKTKYLYEDKYTAYLDLDKLEFPLKIRHRQPGDRFKPLGMHHSKKLKDFFIDEKVPKFERDKVVLFCDNKKIIWVCGYRIDDRLAITQNTDNILKIKLEKISRKKTRKAERIRKK